MNDSCFEMLDLSLEIETKQHEIVQLFTKKSNTHKDKLVRDLKVAKLLGEISTSSKKLETLYETADLSTSYSIEFFYHTLKQIKDDHRRNITFSEKPVQPVIDWQDELDRMFTGEEALGRVLDLHEIYTLYCNLNDSRQMYLKFIQTCDDFSSFVKARKTHAYSAYLARFKDYLESFIRRAMPLFDLDSCKIETAEQFSNDWKQGIEIVMQVVWLGLNVIL